MIQKILPPIIIIVLITCFSANGQTYQSTALVNYIKQCEILLQNEGKWKSINKDHDVKDTSSASYFGYEFSKGIHTNTLVFKITGYFPAKSQWVTSWEGFYTWDYKKQKVIFQAVQVQGAIATGESESISGNEMSVIFTIRNPEGKIEKRKDVFTIEGHQFLSANFIHTSNKWEKKKLSDWHFLEQPAGNITFMSTRDGNWEIYSVNTKGENLKNLSCSKATDYMFSYFPRNNQFIYNTNKDGNDEVYIMSADGKKQTNLSKHPSSDRVATVSPNGKQIVFLSDRDHSEGEIYMMDSAGNNLKRLTSNEYYEDLPNFSPDGKKILFTRVLGDIKDTSSAAIFNGEIFIMDNNGTNEVQLTHRPGGDGGAQISPDGKKIAFHGKSSAGNYDIHIMDIDGKNMINITNDSKEDYSPYWSPDGKWIAYTSGNSKNYDVWIIHIATNIKTRLTIHSKRDESPVWQAAL